MITYPTPQSQPAAFALTPLDAQPTHSLIVALFCVAIGLPLRPELREAGVDDAALLRAELVRREWDVAS